MKKNIFAVCDLEASYACNLMEYLNEKRSTPFEVQAFTNIDSLKNFAADHEIEILLISTRAMCNEVRELSIGRIIILSEGEKLQELDEYPFVYKYQSSDMLLAEVMEYYAADHPKTYIFDSSHHKTEFYGVYSPVGRSRKTLFALTMGEILAETKQVLYVNFENYSGFEEIFHTKYQKDLSDLLYFMRQKEDGFIYKFQSVVQNFHELQYIPPSLSPADIRDVAGSEWIEFLKQIVSCGEYDVVILDLSDQVDDLYHVLGLCDRIFMPIQEDMISQAKITQYERLVRMLDMEFVLDKTRKVKPPIQRIQTDGGDMMQQLVWGEMGNYARKILWETMNSR